MVSELNGINDDLQELIDAMNNERLIIFVGAGISRNSGVPSWSELLNPLKQELELEETDNDPLKIAQYYFVNKGEECYDAKIQEIFGDLESYQPNSLHEFIGFIEPEHIITTNYDYLLEKQLNLDEEKYSVIASDKDIPNAKSKHRIIKMHGDFQHNNIVLKEHDYSRYSDNFPMVSDLVTSLLMDHTVLFIGYSLNDSTFKSLLDDIKRSLGTSARKHFYFTPTRTSQVHIDYYRDIGIELISGDIDIKDDLENEDISERMGSATKKFLTDILKNKIDVSQPMEYPTHLIRSANVKQAKDIWNNIQFLNALNYVESQDIFNYANISDKALLYPRNQVIYRNDSGDRISIRNQNLIDFLQTKTRITNFLDTEISCKDEFDINTKLENAFELYKKKQYLEAFKAFDKISSSSLENHDYWNYFISEFNLNHIVTSYGEKPTRINNTDLDEIVNNVINTGNLNDKRLAIFFREEIQNFRFIYKKLFRINDLLDNFKKEHFSYKRGGRSSNNNLWTAYYEVDSLMTFINANCITIYQYKEFKKIINLYLECLLISLHNKDYRNTQDDFFHYTTSIIDEFSKDDVKLIVSHVNFRNITALMDNYGLKNILVSTEAKVFLYTKIGKLKDELSIKNNSFENINEIESYINFLSLIKNIEVEQIVDILNDYPITQINSTIIKKLLVMIWNNKESIDSTNAIKINTLINKHLYLIISNNYFDMHSINFALYSNILKQTKDISKIDTFLFSEEQILSIFMEMLIDKEKMVELPKYETYIICYYQFFSDKLKQILKEIFENYENINEEDFNIYFAKQIFTMGIYEFPQKKQVLFSSWREAITAAENQTMRVYPDPRYVAIKQIVNSIENGYVTKSELEGYMDLELMKGFIPYVDWNFFKLHTKDIFEKILNEEGSFKNVKINYCHTPDEERLWDEWILEKAYNGQINFVN
ncbi:SIR2 family protein [Lactococcus petauri]|uniref:SIR2 family protein n=1 Tax=Lactococcus petauri TaxID=1940789 RepID=UPI0032E40D17